MFKKHIVKHVTECDDHSNWGKLDAEAKLNLCIAWEVNPPGWVHPVSFWHGSRCCAKNSMRILAAPCCLLRVNILFPSGSGEALLLPELQSGGLKNSGTENFRKGLPETRQCGRTCPDQPHGHFASCRGARGRAPNGSSTTSESGRIWLRICFTPWAIQTWVVTVLQCKISSGICNKFRAQVVHLHLGWRFSGCLGPSRLWRWLLRSSRSAEECAAILADGSVVAWGDRRRGGDCSRVVDACVQYGFHCGRGQWRLSLKTPCSAPAVN